MILNLIRIVQDTISTIIKLFIAYNLIVKYGFSFGMSCYLLTFACYRIFMYKLFRIISLSYNEIPFLAYDTQSILIASIQNEKNELTPAKIKDLIIKEITKNIKRMRLKLTYIYFLFNYYWVETNINEIQTHINIVNEPISTNEVNNYVLKELNNKNELKSDNIPYIIKIIKYTDKNEILLLVKYNRILCDEYTVTKLIYNICGEKVNIHNKTKYKEFINYVKYLPMLLLYNIPLCLYKSILSMFNFKFIKQDDANNIIKTQIGQAHSLDNFTNKCVLNKTTFDKQIYQIIKQTYNLNDNDNIILNTYNKESTSTQLLITTFQQVCTNSNQIHSLTYSTILYILTQFISHRLLYYIIYHSYLKETKIIINILPVIFPPNNNITSILSISCIINYNIPIFSVISHNNSFICTISSNNTDIINNIDSNINHYINVSL